MHPFTLWCWTICSDIQTGWMRYLIKSIGIVLGLVWSSLRQCTLTGERWRGHLSALMGHKRLWIITLTWPERELLIESGRSERISGQVERSRGPTLGRTLIWMKKILALGSPATKWKIEWTTDGPAHFYVFFLFCFGPYLLYFYFFIWTVYRSFLWLT